MKLKLKWKLNYMKVLKKQKEAKVEHEDPEVDAEDGEEEDEEDIEEPYEEDIEDDELGEDEFEETKKLTLEDDELNDTQPDTKVENDTIPQTDDYKPYDETSESESDSSDDESEDEYMSKVNNEKKKWSIFEKHTLKRFQRLMKRCQH